MCFKTLWSLGRQKRREGRQYEGFHFRPNVILTPYVILISGSQPWVPVHPGVREEYQGVRLIIISFRFTIRFLVKMP